MGTISRRSAALCRTRMGRASITALLASLHGRIPADPKRTTCPFSDLPRGTQATFWRGHDPRGEMGKVTRLQTPSWWLKSSLAEFWTREAILRPSRFSLGLRRDKFPLPPPRGRFRVPGAPPPPTASSAPPPPPALRAGGASLSRAIWAPWSAGSGREESSRRALCFAGRAGLSRSARPPFPLLAANLEQMPLPLELPALEIELEVAAGVVASQQIDTFRDPRPSRCLRHIAPLGLFPSNFK